MSEASGRPDDLQRRKRSDRARLTLMAGASVAAIGVYAISGDISQPGSTPAGPGPGSCFRYYQSAEICTSAGVFSAQQCQTAFAGLDSAKVAPDGVLMRATGGAITAKQAVWRQASTGRLVDDTGADVEGSVCRTSSSSSRRSNSSWGFGSSSGGSGGSGSYGSGDSGHSSSNGYAGTSPAVSRGGFGSYGSRFSGGG
ncbi:MAG: hypothetical protein ACOYOJ_01400 [Alsobacter sp.]